MQRRRRLDDVCCELAPQYSKNVIQGFIATGKVFVGGHKVTKNGHQARNPRCLPLCQAVAWLWLVCVACSLAAG